MLAGLDGRKLSEQKYQPLTSMCIGCGAGTPASCRVMALNRSSIRVSNQFSKSGVTGSPSHSPSRMWRAQAPGSEAFHMTGSGRAVIGRAWRRNSSSPTSAHSMSWGTPTKCASTRRASAATASAWFASMAPSRATRHTASWSRTIHSSGVAWPETSRSPEP